MMKITPQEFSRSPFDDSPQIQAVIRFIQNPAQDLVDTSYGHFASQLTELIDRELGFSTELWQQFRSNPMIFPEQQLDKGIDRSEVISISEATMEVISEHLKKKLDGEKCELDQQVDTLIERVVNAAASNDKMPRLTDVITCLEQAEFGKIALTAEFFDDLAAELSGDSRERDQGDAISSASLDALADRHLSADDVQSLSDFMKEMAIAPYNIRFSHDQWRLTKEIQSFLWVGRPDVQDLQATLGTVRQRN